MRDLPRAWPEWIDCKATVALLVAAIAASGSEFLGNDQSRLHMDPALLATEPWRFFTTTLLHGNWMHLAMNVYWTVRLGFVLEAIFGLGWMVVIYLFLGFGSSAAQWAFDGPGVGLSGIGYGLFGLLWALYRFHPRYRPVIDDHVIELFVAWFFVCIALDWFELMPIGNWAHGSGAVLGGLLGWTIAPRRYPRFLRAGALALACGVIVLASTVARPWVNPSGVESDRMRSALAEVRGDGSGAKIEELEARARREPEAAHVWFALGVARGEHGNWNGAAEAFARAHDLAPDEERYRKLHAIGEQLLAAEERSRGRPELALEHLRRSTRLDPDQFTTWKQLAGLLDERGDGDGAIDAYEHAARLDELSEADRAALDRLRAKR